MKILINCCCSLLFFCINGQSQVLIIKGKIKCLNQTENSTKGAENIIVVPTFMPSKATITTSRPTGYFEFNTGVPIAKLQDKIVSIYVVSRCTKCREAVKRVFIFEDQDRQNREDAKGYVTIKEWMLKTNCQQAELVPFAADSVLRLIVVQPGQDLDKVSPASALTGTPAFLNFLTSLISVVGTLPNAGSFVLDSFFQGKIKYGRFLLSSPLSHSANTGFNFSPSRDMSEAVFWNPSAIAQSKKDHNISLFTNVKNNIKLGGYHKMNDKIKLGGGIIYTMQDEFRSVRFRQGAANIQNADSVYMKLKEYAAFISPVYNVNEKVSVALTLKSIWQKFTLPIALFIDGNGVWSISDSTVKQQQFDVDVSATYKISSTIQLGINLMNLAGSKLYADAFVPLKTNGTFQNQRSFGFGALYKWQRLHVGGDILFTEDGFYDAAFGVNYVPFNNALISAGVAVKQLSYSLAFRIKHFRIAYINDNDWMVNEKRKEKSSILNGNIYGGFIFDLN